MQLLVRIFNIAIIILLLFLTIAFTALYLQETSPTFRNSINKYASFLVKILGQGNDLCYKLKIKPLWGIGGVFVISMLYFSVGFRLFDIKLNRFSPFTAFMVSLLVGLSAGIIVTIYYWPEDTIRFGDVFQLKRGSRDKFLDNLIFIAVIVAALHLLLFLFVNLVRWISWKKKAQITK